MPNQAMPLLKKGNRRNFFMIIDPENTVPVKVTKPTSVLDVAPTVLSFLGFKEESLGFGRNLLGAEKTLFEEKEDMANPFLISMKKVMEAELWEFPTLTEGAIFNFEEKTLKIGKRSLSTPVFITRDDEDNPISIEIDPKSLCSVSKMGGVIKKDVLSQSMTLLPPLQDVP